MRTASPLRADDFLKKAVSVASYYGFASADSVLDAPFSAKRGMRLEPYHRRDPFAYVSCALMYSLAQRAAPERPFLLYHANPRDRKQREGAMHPPRFGLSVIGVEKSVAEALVLHTTTAILNEVGAKTYCVHINSIGDRDSATKFAREVSSYIRKHLNGMPVAFQTTFRRDAFQALESIMYEDHPLANGMPRPMQFLSDASRRHLREILEYLEIADIPYRIDERLIGHKDCYTQTLFEIRMTADEKDGDTTVIGRGGRCDELSRRFFRTVVPAAGIVINGGKSRRSRTLPKAPNRRPRVYLIQLGFGAKLQSFPIIEMLRKARIPIRQSLGDDQLNNQLTTAAELGIPFALIIGQREALERTVILRDMATQAQQTIPVITLPTYLRQIQH